MNKNPMDHEKIAFLLDLTIKNYPELLEAAEEKEKK